MRELTEAEKGYTAGLIDGEGHIGMTRTKTYRCVSETYQIRVSVSNTNLALLHWLEDKTGMGEVVPAGKRRKEIHKLAYKWQLHVDEISAFLAMIMPYLVIKKEQAELMVEFLQIGRTDKDDTKKLVLKSVICDELANLNKRGN